MVRAAYWSLEKRFVGKAEDEEITGWTIDGTDDRDDGELRKGHGEEGGNGGVNGGWEEKGAGEEDEKMVVELCSSFRHQSEMK